MTVHVLFTPIVPPAKLIELGVLVTRPPHCAGLGTLEIVIPAGKVSVNATPLMGTVLAAGFLRVKVSTEFAPAGMLAGAKALLMVGGVMTVNVSQAALWLRACWLFVRASTGIQFV